MGIIFYFTGDYGTNQITSSYRGSAIALALPVALPCTSILVPYYLYSRGQVPGRKVEKGFA